MNTKTSRKPIEKKLVTGTCYFHSTSPHHSNLDATTRVINVAITFEDALKLNLAIDECVRRLNRYNRSRRTGKQVGVGLIIYLDKRRINVMERKLPVLSEGAGETE